MNAFERWLIAAPKAEAVQHLMVCLAAGGDAAWELLEDIHGPLWRCPAKDFPEFVAQTIDKLKEVHKCV